MARVILKNTKEQNIGPPTKRLCKLNFTDFANIKLTFEIF